MIKIATIRDRVEVWDPEEYPAITERIKTFEDAYKWCEENGKIYLVIEWELVKENFAISKDILAYLQLRIIAAALNEGWEPKFEYRESRWSVNYDTEEYVWRCQSESIFADVSPEITMKSAELAIYSAKQFTDIYRDYFGVIKRGKK